MFPTKNTRVVFLDYDGVVNIAMWQTVITYNADMSGHTHKRQCRYNMPSDGTVNHYQAVQWLSEFCQKYGYEIVVTSTWKSNPNWADCLRRGGLRDDVVIKGCIGNDKPTRGENVKQYISEHPEISGYVIFDDECDYTPEQMDRLVICNPSHGFCQDEYNAAMSIHHAFNE